MLLKIHLNNGNKPQKMTYWLIRSFKIPMRHQSKLRFMYSNSNFILDDFVVTRHNSNKFDFALV